MEKYLIMKQKEKKHLFPYDFFLNKKNLHSLSSSSEFRFFLIHERLVNLFNEFIIISQYG